MELTAVYRQVPEGGCVAWIQEFPGALTQGETLDEARANLDEAVRLPIDVNREMHADNTGQAMREPLVIAE